MKISPKFSVIIINYNGEEFIEKCLRSVLCTDYPDFEVLLVDNASTDNSVKCIQQQFTSSPILKILLNKKNAGFAQGNNVAAKYATGDYLVFLNIDTIVDKNWLFQLSKTLSRHPMVGAAQCKLLLMDDPSKIDSAGHFMDWFGIAYVRGHKRQDEGQYSQTEEIFGATGAALAIKTSVFQKIGGFDKDFFMLFEEDDLCWRAWLQGFKVLYAPKAIVYHKSSGIRSKEGNIKNLYLSRRNRITSLLKNYSARNLVRFMPIHLGLMFLIALVTKEKLEYIRALLKAENNVLLNLKAVIRKRKEIQTTRRVSDQELLRSGVIRKPSIKEMIKSGY